MRTIHKKISLEEFKSRMPSVIPAYDEKGNVHNFNKRDILVDEPIVNYNMLPFDVHIEQNDSYGQYSNQLYSYQSLSQIFHTLDSYYNKSITNECKEIINISNEDKNFYKWLVTYCFPFFVFDIELENSEVNVNNIKDYWGTNRLSIQDVDYWLGRMKDISGTTDCCSENEYNKRGGDSMVQCLKEWYDSPKNVIICNYNDYNRNFTYYPQDTDSFVKVKVVKTLSNETTIVTMHNFPIHEPKEKILGKNRYIKYGRLDSKNNIINPQDIEIINGVLTIPQLFSSNDKVLVVKEPEFVIPILLTNQMENIGEMISICEEWDGGYEYNQNIHNQELIDYNGGAMVYYNGDNWILKSYDFPGYIYSETYQEIYFANENGMSDSEYEYFSEENNQLKNGYNYSTQWERYMDFLPKIEGLKLNNYAYKDTQLILSPNLYNMGDKYVINTNGELGFSLYKEAIYPNYECDAIIFNNMYYEVFYDFIYTANNGITQKYKPYIIIENVHFYLNENECTNPNINYNIFTETFIQYNNTLVLSSPLNHIDGYLLHEGKYVYFAKLDNNVMSASTTNIGEYKTINEMASLTDFLQCYTTFQENEIWYAVISKPYDSYNSEYISGSTTSKLSDFLKGVKKATDNLGHKLDGLMPYKFIRKITLNDNDNDEENTQKELYDYVVNPCPNDWLSIPYIPKQVINVEEIETNVYWGNIIDKVIIEYDIEKVIDDIEKLPQEEIEINAEFYKSLFLDGNMNIISTTTCQEISKERYILDVAKSIKTWKVYTHFKHECLTDSILKNVEEIMRKNYHIMFNVQCHVEYYMGTIIDKVNDNKYFLKTKDNGDYYGVKYIDTFSLQNKQCLYYYDEIDTCILNYWEMKPTIGTYTNQTYNVKNLSEPISYFEFKIQPFDLKYGYKLYNDSKSYTFYNVSESATIVEYKGEKYQIEINNGKKFFTFSLPHSNEETLFQDYEYYCIVNNEKKYAQYVQGVIPKFVLRLNDDIVYESNGLRNYWIDDDEKEISYIIYCQIPIKLFLLTPQNTADIYFDSFNNTSVAPLIIDETKIGSVMQEKIQNSDIYIDRGTVRAIDYHLRLLEAKSLESLEQIGNGFFKFNSNNEVK